MRRAALGVIAIAAVAFLAPAPAATAAEPDFARIDAYVREQIAEGRMPGLGLAIVHGGQVVHLAGFGVADPTGRPVTPQTPFILGSVSKSFTALAVMQLVESGQIELDAPVRRYLPWFEVADAGASARMTVRQLLHHTSGLPASAGYQPIFFEGIDTGPDALERGVRALRTAKLDRPLGSEYEYCNANYNTLGLIVQVVSGQPYERYVAERIFAPLEMRNAFAALAPAQAAGLATGYRRFFAWLVPSPDFPYPPSFLPCGFLIASAEDMAHYAIAQLNEGRFGTASVLSPGGVDAMHRGAARLSPGRELYYGMGWVTRKPNGIPVVWHNGDTGHFHSEVMLDPAGRWGVVTLVNGSHWLAGQRFETLTTGVLSLLVGKDVPNDDNIHRVIFAIYLVFFVVPALMLLFLARRLRALRRWRAEPASRPRGGKRLRLLLLPLLSSALAALAFVAVTPQLFGGAAPLSEILYSMPDMGLGIVLTVLGALAWLAVTVVTARVLRSSPAAAPAA